MCHEQSLPAPSMILALIATMCGSHPVNAANIMLIEQLHPFCIGDVALEGAQM